ncbi:MAG: hypothetical protein K6U88_14055, partial [Dehalococcoidia bacterium]|nr:hypothetical protein [Dehalococcoidia bacterium]
MTAIAASRTRSELVASMVDRAAREARVVGRPVVVAGWLRAQEFDPIAAFERAEPGARTLWLQPDAGFAIVGSGFGGRFVGGGPDRFARALTWWREFTQGALVDASPGPLPAPLCVGGFSFDPAARRADGAWRAFADADLTAPAVALVRRGGEAWALLTAQARPDDDPRELARELGGRLERLL